MTHCHYGTLVGVLSERENLCYFFFIADLAFAQLCQLHEIV